jgi:hypothetical protein
MLMRIDEMYLIAFKQKIVLNNDELIELVSRNDTILRIWHYTAGFKKFSLLFNGTNALVIFCEA